MSEFNHQHILVDWLAQLTLEKFVEKVVGIEGISRGGLGSATTEISVVKFPFTGFVNAKICLIDTPGLDSRRGVYDVCKMISDWLNNIYHKERSLAGLLFFHRISDTDAKMLTLSPAKWRCLQRLCGDELNRLTLTTSMWDDVVDDGPSTVHEDALKRTLKPLLDEGLLLKRFLNDQDSAFDILRPIVQAELNRQSTIGRVLFMGRSLAASAIKNLQRDVPPIIICIGPYGCGKSQFIDRLNLEFTRTTTWANHTMLLREDDVHPVKAKLPNGNGIVILVDTPGIDDYTWTVEDVLESVYLWLIQKYGKGTTVAGVLYFQDIRHIGRFEPPPGPVLEQLAGASAINKLIFITTYWNFCTLHKATARERDIRSRLSSYLVSGAHMYRFDGNRETAWKILDTLL